MKFQKNKIALVFPSIFLITLVSTYAQKTDTLDNSKARGYPWIAHSSFDAFYLPSPANLNGSAAYQVSTYQAFTIQSLSFASFHLGFRSRETLAPNFTKPYREAASLKLASTVELMPEYVYATIGGNIPLVSDTFSIQDTAALYQTLNNFSPMPYANFLSPQAVAIGLFGKYSTPNWTALTGFSYVKPGIYSDISDRILYPAAYFNFLARGNLETNRSRHRLDAKVTFYSEESNSTRIPAHIEGDVFQLRYGLIRSNGKVGYQSGMGVTFKLPDANRKLKLRAPLATTSSNDNLQQMMAELAISWIPKPHLFWRVHILPRAFFSLAEQTAGFESELGLGMGLKIWEVHRLKTSGQLLVGEYAGDNYFGMGVRAEFAFRHLGFQDLESLNEGGE